MNIGKECKHEFNECYSDCKKYWNTIKESEECKKWNKLLQVF